MSNFLAPQVLLNLNFLASKMSSKENYKNDNERN